jgi:BirA family biotin operon repressor/biotin-[acetyl-CoA-carboxylase] ligase
MTGGGSSSLSLPNGFRAIVHDRLDSTNAEALRLARAGADALTLVWAERQTAGRGRHGRTWDSPPGNLYCSLLLCPRCALGEAAQLGFVAGLAVAEALAALLATGVPVSLKWPNDVLLDGRKVAGILLESQTDADARLTALAIGIGVNVAVAPTDARFPATTLRAAGAAADVAPVAVLNGFARRFSVWLARWQAAGFAPVRSAWLDRAHGLGQAIAVRLGDERLDGVFADLDAGGALRLDRPGLPPRAVSAGEVYFPSGTG